MGSTRKGKKAGGGKGEKVGRSEKDGKSGDAGKGRKAGGSAKRGKRARAHVGETSRYSISLWFDKN